MTGSKISAFTLILAATSLSACSTVKMPDLNIFKESEFEKEATNIPDYPKVSEAPAAPTNIRAGSYWDAEAQKLIDARDKFKTPAAVDGMRSEEELAREADALKAKVNAYKADDPQ